MSGLRMLAASVVCVTAVSTLPAHAHAIAHGSGSGWAWLLLTGVLLLVAAELYVVGWRRLSRRARNGGVGRWRAAAFAAAWAVTSAALVSPIDAWSGELFVVHMIQHELLMLIAAPLFIFSRPAPVMLWALPQTARQTVGRLAASKGWRGFWRGLAHPATAWCAYAFALWLWHAPPLFQAALVNDGVHALQHVSFLAGALLFWWAFLEPHRSRSMEGVAVLANFTTAIHASILGAAFTFSQTVWYESYFLTTHHWGLSAVEDQQLGGLVMWIPGGIVHVLAAVLVLTPILRSTSGEPAPLRNRGLQ